MDQPTLKISKKGFTLPSGEIVPLGEVLQDIDKLKSISPIEFHKPYGIQSEILSCDSSKILVCGGNRAGKTEIVISRVLRKCLDKPRQKWWIAGETFQDSIAIQQAKMWSLVPKHLIKYGKYNEINGFTNRKLLLKNGSLIVFKSYDQERESFQGDEVDGVLFDEECPFGIFQECKMRVIDRDGELLLSMTSLKGVTELIENLYEDSDILRSEYAGMVKEELPRVAEKDDVKIFFLWSTENPHIPQHRVTKECKLLTRDEIKQRIYGLPLNLAGRVYVSMNKMIHITTLEDMPEGKYTIYMGLDPHDRKPWAIMWVAVHKTGTAYVIDEYPNKNFNEMKYDNKTYKEYGDIIRQKERDIEDIFGERVRRRILDPNFGNKTVQLAQRQGGQSTTTPKKELQKLGFTFRDGIDALEAGHLKVREWLHYDRDQTTGEIIVQPKLMFLEKCHNTIRHMTRYARKDVTTASGDEKDRVGVQEKYKDFCDDLRYILMSNPIYAEDVQEEDFKKAY